MKNLSRLFMLILLMLLLTACGAQGVAQSVIELPSPVQLAILAGVTFVVGFIFTKSAAAIPPLAAFLGQYVDEVSTAVAGALVLWIQSLLNAVPPEWEGVANAALAFIVAVMAAIGLIKTARKARVPGFRG